MRLKSFIKSHAGIICMVILFLIVIIAVAQGIHTVRGWLYDLSSYEIKDFSSYRNDLENLSAFSRNIYNEEKKVAPDLNRVTISQFGSNVSVHYRYNDIADSPYNEDILIELSDAEKTWLAAAFDAFSGCKYGGFSYISVDDNYVILHTDTYYTLIYSENCMKPKYMSGPNEPYASVYYDRISLHWFQCVGKLN